MHRKKLVITGWITVIVAAMFMMYMLLSAFGILGSGSTKRSITLSTQTVEKIYDGTPLVSNAYELLDGTLRDGDHIVVKASTQITDVTEHPIENKLIIEIVNRDLKDVTNKYDITYVFGQLHVKKRELVIESSYQVKPYDGEVLVSDEDYTKLGLLNGDQTQMISKTELTDAGEKINEIRVTVKNSSNQDVTANYQIIYRNNTLKVVPAIITVKTLDLKKIYDGTTLKDEKEPEVKGLPAGYTYQHTYINQLENVGIVDNEVALKIYDRYNQDVTTNFDIKATLGTLEIEAIKVTVVSKSVTKVYDGNELIAHEFDFIPESKEMIGDKFVFSAIYSGTISDVGSVPNVFEIVSVLDGLKHESINNFEIEYVYGTLTLISSIYETQTVARSYKSVQLSKDSAVLDVTTSKRGALYLRHRSWGDYQNGTWESDDHLSNTQALFFANQAVHAAYKTPERLTIDYKRSQLYFLYPYYIKDSLKSYHDSFPEQKKIDTQTFEFITYNVFSNQPLLVPSVLRELEASYYNQVQAHYLSVPEALKPQLETEINLIFKNGSSATVTQEVKQVMAYLKEKYTFNEKFDIQKENETSDLLSDFLKSFKGDAQHFASIATLLLRQRGIPARYTTGYYTNISDPNKVTTLYEKNAHAWVEVYLKGMGWVPVEVSPHIQAQAELSFKPVDVKKQYDGTPLLPTQVQVSGFNDYEKLGYTYEVMFKHHPETTPGKRATEIEKVVIKNKEGHDATDEFLIELKTGEAHIYKQQMILQTGSQEKVFDNTPLVYHSYVVTGLIDDDNAQVTFRKSLTAVGKTSNTANIRITDSSGRDITDHYEIITDFGILEVSRRQVYVLSESATKPFDDTPLIHHVISQMGLLEGDVIDYTFTGSQTRFGQSENTFKVNKIMRNGRDVTSQYVITLKYGTLVISAPVS